MAASTALQLTPPCTFNNNDQSGHVSVYSYPELSLEDGFDAVIRVALHDEASATKWLTDYQEESLVTLRVLTTKPESGRVNLYKVYYRCHHNTLPRSEKADLRPKSKNTSCPAQVVVTVKRIPGKHSRAKVKDLHLPKFATIIRIQHNHNHQIICVDALKFRDVSEEVTAKFSELFSKGHSPSSALDVHKLDLQLSHGTSYYFEVADRAKCPDLQFCQRFYRKIFSKSVSGSDSEKMVKLLETSIKSYNQDASLECCKMEQVNGALAIAICTPLMQKIHTHHPCSGDVVFIHSTHGLRCQLFVILTHSAVGGLPLGCLITSSDSHETFLLALKLYAQIVPDGAFYGRGKCGPAVFLSDDNDSQRRSLKEVYPESSTLLCVLLLLQTTWRYLWDKKNTITPRHRTYLLGLVQGLMYANTCEDLEWKYAQLTVDVIAKSYPNFMKHVERLYAQRQHWAADVRERLTVCGNSTVDHVEAAMRVLKDQIVHRVHAYNPVQLLHYSLTRIVSYYERRFNELSCGKVDVTVARRYLLGNAKISPEMVSPLDMPYFQVQSVSKTDKKYEVDMSLAMCTCCVGMCGAPCKHQYAVLKHCKVYSFKFLPISIEPMVPTASSSRQTHEQEHWSIPPPEHPTNTPNRKETNEPNHKQQERWEETEENRTNIRHLKRTQSLDDLEAGLKTMTRNLIKQMRASPQDLAPAIDTYLKQHKKLKTRSATVAALMTFGK